MTAMPAAPAQDDLLMPRTFPARTLCEALESAFDPGAFQQFVSYRLGLQLWLSLRTDTFRNSVFDLVRNCIQQARTRGLIAAAKETRPGNKLVAELDEGAEYVFPEGGNGGPSDELRDGVRALRNALRNRQPALRYLPANKSLHDLLHNLQKLQPRVTEVADRAATTGRPTPDSKNLIKVLRRYVEEARKHAAIAGEARPPEDPTVWIDECERAVDTLDHSQGELTPERQAELRQAVQVLANLPADNQGGLNREIYAHARGLNTRELEDLAGRIGCSTDPAVTQNLRDRLDQFRQQCAEVTGLVADHNLCQAIDRDLDEVAGLVPDATPRKWDRLRLGLLQLAERRDDTARVGGAVDRFGEAIQGGDREAVVESVGKLVDEFHLLFQAIDRRLREAANGLPVAALELQPLLESLM